MIVLGAILPLLKIMYVIGLLGYVLLFLYSILFLTNSEKNVKKAVITLFFIISVFSARQEIASSSNFLKFDFNIGTLFFYFYLFVVLFHRIPDRVNALFGLLSLCMIPITKLLGYTYIAEAFGILAFSQLIVGIIQKGIVLRYDRVESLHS